MKSLPTTVQPNNTVLINNNQIIPRVIYQTWKSNEMPDYLYNCAYTWIDKNPDYRYEFYDDTRLEKFIYNFDCSNFSFSKEQLIKAYNSYAHPVGRADLWRYLIMYSNGGVYMDIDMICDKPLREYIDTDSTYITGKDPDRGIHQWGIIISQYHPFMKETIENVIDCTLHRKRIPGTEHASDNLEVYTGPYVMNYSIKKLLKINPQRHFPAGTFYPKIKNKTYIIKILPNKHMNGYVLFHHQNYFNALKANNIQYWTESAVWK